MIDGRGILEPSASVMGMGSRRIAGVFGQAPTNMRSSLRRAAPPNPDPFRRSRRSLANTCANVTDRIVPKTLIPTKKRTKKRIPGVLDEKGPHLRDVFRHGFADYKTSLRARIKKNPKRSAESRLRLRGSVGRLWVFSFSRDLRFLLVRASM